MGTLGADSGGYSLGLKKIIIIIITTTTRNSVLQVLIQAQEKSYVSKNGLEGMLGGGAPPLLAFFISGGRRGLIWKLKGLGSVHGALAQPSNPTQTKRLLVKQGPLRKCRSRQGVGGSNT